MNTLKEIPTLHQQEPIKKAQKNKVGAYFFSIVSGSFLSKEETLKLLPFVLFLFAMAILYIANGYYSEGKIREWSKITNEIKELRSEYITKKSDLMFISKQSEVAKAALKLNIKESVVPPKKILVEATSDHIRNHHKD